MATGCSEAEGSIARFDMMAGVERESEGRTSEEGKKGGLMGKKGGPVFAFIHPHGRSVSCVKLRSL